MLCSMTCRTSLRGRRWVYQYMGIREIPGRSRQRAASHAQHFHLFMFKPRAIRITKYARSSDNHYRPFFQRSKCKVTPTSSISTAREASCEFDDERWHKATTRWSRAPRAQWNLQTRCKPAVRSLRFAQRVRSCLHGAPRSHSTFACTCRVTSDQGVDFLQHLRGITWLCRNIRALDIFE